MKYELVMNDDQMVELVLKTGTRYVKNTVKMNPQLQTLLELGDITPSDLPEYDICIDGIWYFHAKEKRRPRKKKEDEELL